MSGKEDCFFNVMEKKRFALCKSEKMLVMVSHADRLWILQKFLSTMNTVEAMEFLIDKVRNTKTNQEFWEAMSKKKTGGSIS